MENVEHKKKKPLISQEDIMKLLDSCYLKANHGIPKVSPPVEELAKNYLDKYEDVLSASKAFVNAQVAKCATSGFVNSFGGFLTLPISISANIGSVVYVQMRMIGAIAVMGGYDLKSDQVQTLIYSCLAGVALTGIAKKTIQQFGTKFTTVLIKRIPGKVITKINKKVGFRFLTKMGSKGTINLINLVPGVSAVVNATIDGADTKIIGERAIKWFIHGDFSVKSKKGEEEIIIDCSADDDREE